MWIRSAWSCGHPEHVRYDEQRQTVGELTQVELTVVGHLRQHVVDGALDALAQGGDVARSEGCLGLIAQARVLLADVSLDVAALEQSSAS